MRTILLIFFLVPLTMFILTWYEHSKQVQEWVGESFNEYVEDQPNWTELDEQTTEELSELTIKSISELNLVFGGSFDQEERYAFKESLYDLNYANLNHYELEPAFEEVQHRYTEWKEAINYFLNSRLYAMYHTF